MFQNVAGSRAKEIKSNAIPSTGCLKEYLKGDTNRNIKIGKTRTDEMNHTRTVRRDESASEKPPKPENDVIYVIAGLPQGQHWAQGNEDDKSHAHTVT
jgi:hypothetical protein